MLIFILLPDISKWVTKKVQDMKNMFNECKNLIILPNLTNSKIIYTKISATYECSSLKSLPDISKWHINNYFRYNTYKGFESLIYKYNNN